jgi:hypothetical protein
VFRINTVVGGILAWQRSYSPTKAEDFGLTEDLIRVFCLGKQIGSMEQSRVALWLLFSSHHTRRIGVHFGGQLFLVHLMPRDERHKSDKDRKPSLMYNGGVQEHIRGDPQLV